MRLTRDALRCKREADLAGDGGQRNRFAAGSEFGPSPHTVPRRTTARPHGTVIPRALAREQSALSHDEHVTL